MNITLFEIEDWEREALNVIIHPHSEGVKLCKRTSNPPFCDGSHKAITQEELDANQGLEVVWYKVAEPNALQAGEVSSVQAGSKTVALTYFNGEYGALDFSPSMR